MNNVSNRTAELVNEWLNACKSVSDLETQLNSARCRKDNAQNELGRWLVPVDQADGVSFNIWFGSGIIEAMRRDNNNYYVSWRKKPDGKHGQEIAHLL